MGRRQLRRVCVLCACALTTSFTFVPTTLTPRTASSPPRFPTTRLRSSVAASTPSDGVSISEAAFHAGLLSRVSRMRAAHGSTTHREDPAPLLSSQLNQDTAWVVLFRSDSGDGIHSLSSGGRELVLAFEGFDEASGFAAALAAQGFFRPAPHSRQRPPHRM